MPTHAAGPSAIRAAIQRSTEYMLDSQDPSGLWLSEVTGMTATTALYLLVLDETGARHTHSAQVDRAVGWLLANQQPNGAWGERLGADHHLQVYTNEYTALALLALRRFLAADAPAVAHGECFLDGRPVGGAQMRDPFIRLLFNLYAGTQWAIERRFLPIPLSEVPAWAESGRLPATTEAILVTTVLLMVQYFQRTGQAGPGDADLEHWCLERLPVLQTPDGGWQAVVMTAELAIKGLHDAGQGPENPCVKKALDYLTGVQNADGGLPVHSGLSVWETGLAMIALRCGGLPPEDPALLRGAEALLGVQVTNGSWGWEHTPGQAIAGDVDDTSVALLALHSAAHPVKDNAVRRAAAWLAEHQSSSGGWATFDVEVDDLPLEIVRAQVDTTAHAVEALAAITGAGSPAVRRGWHWLLDHQRKNGSWRGYWFARYVYGTMSALCALGTGDQVAGRVAMARAVGWLLAEQRSDGGWGEDADGRPWHSTVEQTAWAVHALLSAGEPADRDAVCRGLTFILDQIPDQGMWAPASVGTYTNRFAGAYGTRLLPAIHSLIVLAHYQARAAGHAGLPVCYG